MAEVDVTKQLFDPSNLDVSAANINTGASYTGAWVFCGGFDRIRFTAIADQILQVHVEFSNDGANIDAISLEYETTGVTIGDGWDAAVYARYCRLVADNASGVNTTSCRLGLRGAR